MRVLPAFRRTTRRLYRRHTQKIRIPHKVRIADALVRFRVARRTDPTNYPFAATLATPAYADARLGTWHVRRTNVRCTFTSGERIPHETFDTLARWTVVTHDTLSSGTANETVAF